MDILDHDLPAVRGHFAYDHPRGVKKVGDRSLPEPLKFASALPITLFRIAQAKFRGWDDLGSAGVGVKRCCAPGTTAADNKDVRRILRVTSRFSGIELSPSSRAANSTTVLSLAFGPNQIGR